MFLLLRRRAQARLAFLLTLVFAFGTTTWVIGSQALWQHGLGELLIVGRAAARHRTGNSVARGSGRNRPWG